MTNDNKPIDPLSWPDESMGLLAGAAALAGDERAFFLAVSNRPGMWTHNTYSNGPAQTIADTLAIINKTSPETARRLWAGLLSQAQESIKKNMADWSREDSTNALRNMRSLATRPQTMPDFDPPDHLSREASIRAVRFIVKNSPPKIDLFEGDPANGFWMGAIRGVSSSNDIGPELLAGIEEGSCSKMIASAVHSILCGSRSSGSLNQREDTRIVDSLFTLFEPITQSLSKSGLTKALDEFLLACNFAAARGPWEPENDKRAFLLLKSIEGFSSERWAKHADNFWYNSTNALFSTLCDPQTAGQALFAIAARKSPIPSSSMPSLRLCGRAGLPNSRAAGLALVECRKIEDHCFPCKAGQEQKRDLECIKELVESIKPSFAASFMELRGFDKNQIRKTVTECLTGAKRVLLRRYESSGTYGDDEIIELVAAFAAEGADMRSVADLARQFPDIKDQAMALAEAKCLNRKVRAGVTQKKSSKPSEPRSQNTKPSL